MIKETTIYAHNWELDEKEKAPVFTYRIKTVLISQEEINDSYTIKTEFGMEMNFFPPKNNPLYITKPVILEQEVKASYIEKKDDCYLLFLEERKKDGSILVGSGHRIDVKHKLVASFPVKGTVIITK